MITGTNMPANLTGECPHLHRTPEAAQACIDRMAAGPTGNGLLHRPCRHAGRWREGGTTLTDLSTVRVTKRVYDEYTGEWGYR